jgi:hypothetical protein
VTSVRALSLLLAIAVCGPSSARAQVITDMTPQDIEKAIRAGEKGDVPSGAISKSSGWSWGSIYLATFSTPYMRVAAASRAAKKAYKKFTPADVTPEMVAPELHVYGWSQMNGNQPTQAPLGGGALHDSAARGAVSVSAVVITPKKGKQEEKQAAAIQPLRFEPLPTVWQNLFGARTEAEGMLAVFPLSALSEDNEVHIVYERPVTMGTNAMGGRHCEDCSASFSLKGVK